MTVKNPLTSIEQLSTVTASYRKLLIRAIKNTSPNDTTNLQRLGTGLTALTKAVNTIAKLKAEDKWQTEKKEPVDFDIMGNPIYRVG